jgi:hypothetical protein
MHGWLFSTANAVVIVISGVLVTHTHPNIIIFIDIIIKCLSQGQWVTVFSGCQCIFIHDISQDSDLRY